MDPKSQRKTVRWYFRLVLVEDLALFAALVSIPADPKNAWLLGMSPSRLAILAFVALMTLAALWLVIKDRVHQDWTAKPIRRLASLSEREGVYLTLLSLLGVVGTASLLAYRFGAITTDEFIRAYYIRLRPLFLWTVVVCAQTVAALRVFRSGWGWRGGKAERKNLVSVLVPLGLVAGFSLWVVVGKISVVKDFYAWGDPGVPITGEQVLLALGLSVVVTLLLGLISVFLPRDAGVHPVRKLAGLPIFQRQVVIALVLWVVTIWLWSSTELRPSYFSPDPRTPNFEYYPYSDASLYDRSAHLLLIGEGFEPTVRRPIYSAFLALAQAVSGMGTEAVLQWQIPLLALIPALLYLMTQKLHRPISALLVAFLAIFHEVNAIALAGVVNVSHAKLLMSDLPTALGVIGFTYASVKWMKTKGERSYLALIAGGVIGLTILVRLQAIIILPPVVVLAWFSTSKPPRERLKEVLILAAGLMLVVGPWVYRNWQKTGEFTFGTDPSQTGLIQQRYSPTEEEYAGPPGGDPTLEDNPAPVLGNSWTFVRQHPGEFLRFTSAHFANNQVATLLVLPARSNLVENLKTYYELSPFWEGPGLKLWEQCCWQSAYVAGLPYWNGWDGVWEKESIAPLIFNLFLISIGIGVLWSQHGAAGLVPLVVALSYSLGNGLIRNSGWRFNLPVDWIGFFLYAIGIGQVILWVVGLMVDRALPAAETPSRPRRQHPRIIMGISCLVFFGIGAAIPIAERVIQPRYDPGRVSEMLADLEDELTAAGLDPEKVETALEEGGLTAGVGRALYPRFYPAGMGEPGNGWPAFAPQDYSRLGFLVVGPRDMQAILPLSAPPAAFAHGSDVLVLGCMGDDTLEASLVVNLGSEPKGILTAATPAWGCPSLGE